MTSSTAKMELSNEKKRVVIIETYISFEEIMKNYLENPQFAHSTEKNEHSLYR